MKFFKTYVLHPMNFFTTLRTKQIRKTARWLINLQRLPRLTALVSRLQKTAAGLPLTRALVGYRRAFAALDDAKAAVRGYEAGGHTSQAACAVHVALAEHGAPSDYATAFHIQAHLKDIESVFDAGGNAGNVYYFCARRMQLPASFRWVVQDLPEVVAAGRRIAAERAATHLSFTTELKDAEGCGLFLVSGALHYFDPPIPDVLAQFDRKPRFVLVNRTPLTEGAAFATIQEAPNYRVACMIYNRADLFSRFERAGYALVDTWRAEELSVHMPLDPARSVAAYTGAFFQLKA